MRYLTGSSAAALAAVMILSACGAGVDAPAVPAAGASAAPKTVYITPAPLPGLGIPPPSERIIHAGGNIGGFTGTNSKDALSFAYNNGRRYIELDFELTSDDAPVCIHDWNQNFLPGYSEADFPLSLADFESSLIFGELTPLTLDSLSEWLYEHDGVYIITDCKQNNLQILGMIAHSRPELIARFIPQIYFPAELDAVKAMGFANVIFTLYRLDWETKTDAGYIADFAKTNKLWGIAFPVELTERDGYVDALLEAGVPLYTHTVNKESDISAQLAMGITGVYSDMQG